ILVLALICPARATDLTLEQIESIKIRAKSIQENLDNHLSSRNSSAGARFAAAAADPKAAIALYLDCHKVVNFDREGRPESDFRAWKDVQEDRLKEPNSIESLRLQLSYLALSCKAAEAEKLEEVFAPLMSYADSLSRMQELPTNAMTASVAQSVFSEAFYLKKLLGGNEGWEPVPFNIAGMYEKTIFPYLRSENPSALMSAWDKRIEQQSKIVQMINDHKEAALRGLDRDEQRRARDNEDRQGARNRQGGQDGQNGIMRTLDIDDFTARTLPRMRWDRLKDMFLYVSEYQAAQEMLPFLEEHLTHELGEDFFSEFDQLINEASTESDRIPGATNQ
ncbi:MAG: hypothetical protein AAF357_13070, partial [Verrucomicrobiota bacterium]